MGLRHCESLLLVLRESLISNIENFFSVALIIFIPGKVKNKKKVRTSQNHVFNLCKS